MTKKFKKFPISDPCNTKVKKYWNKMLKMYKMLSMENIKEKTIVCIAQQLIIAQQMSWGVTHPTSPPVGKQFHLQEKRNKLECCSSAAINVTRIVKKSGSYNHVMAMHEP